MKDSYTVVGGTYQKLKAQGFETPFNRALLLDDYARRFLPAALREARTARGLTQAQVAERLGVNQSNYGRLERGGNMALSLALFVRVAKALDLGMIMRPSSFDEMIEDIEKIRDFS